MPRQFGVGEHVVFTGDIVPKTLTLFLKWSSEGMRLVRQRGDQARLERASASLPALVLRQVVANQPQKDFPVLARLGCTHTVNPQ